MNPDPLYTPPDPEPLIVQDSPPIPVRIAYLGLGLCIGVVVGVVLGAGL